MSEIDKIPAEIEERIRELERERIRALEWERDFYKHAYYELIDKMMEARHDDSRRCNAGDQFA